MGQKVTLAEICENISRMNTEETIYAQEPWTSSSPASLFPDEEDLRTPPASITLGLAYFLEVNIAIEVVEDYEFNLGRKASAQEICERLIYYAINDA